MITQLADADVLAVIDPTVKIDQPHHRSDSFCRSRAYCDELIAGSIVPRNATTMMIARPKHCSSRI